MTRIIAALVAVGVAGLFGSVITNDAQDAEKEATPIERKVVVIEKDGEVEVIELKDGKTVKRTVRDEDFDDEDIRLPRGHVERDVAEAMQRALRNRHEAETRLNRARGMMGGMMNRPGTWELERSGEGMILLNTATGETFVLRGDDDKLHWQPIPMPKGPRAPSFGPRRDMPRPDGDRERTRDRERAEHERAIDKYENWIEDVEEAIEELHEELEEAEEDRDDDDADDLREEIEEHEKKLKKLQKELRKLRK